MVPFTGFHAGLSISRKAFYFLEKAQSLFNLCLIHLKLGVILKFSCTIFASAAEKMIANVLSSLFDTQIIAFSEIYLILYSSDSFLSSSFLSLIKTNLIRL